MTADRIVTELARIAFADIRSFADWGPNGVDLRPLAEISADDAPAIAEIYGAGKAGGRPKLKLHDKRVSIGDFINTPRFNPRRHVRAAYRHLHRLQAAPRGQNVKGRDR